MQIPLTDQDHWRRKGISLLWNVNALNQLCEVDEIISLRRFCRLDKRDWQEGEYGKLLVKDRAMIVAGLDACMDALSPEKMSDWLEENIRLAMMNFQREVADGGNEAALIFWFADESRIEARPFCQESTWVWLCGGEYKGEYIPISRCLFGGAKGDLQEIQNRNGRRIGLYHPRIS